MSWVEIEPLPPRFDSCLRELLRGREADWPRDATDAEADQFLASTASHGIQPLLHDRSHLLRGAPPIVAGRLRDAALMESAIDALRTANLRDLLDALRAARIPALVFKGSALARTHYPSPALRPRADHDLLIRRDDLSRVASIVEAGGYWPSLAIEDDAVFSERTFTGRLGGSIPFAIDVHWRCSNLEGVADALTVDELFDRSIGFSDDEISLRVPCPVDALIVAAVHRAAHHFGTDRLLWLYDVHLLFERLSGGEEDELWRRSGDRGVSSLTADALNRAAGWFGTRPPARGAWPMPVDSGERAARLLKPGRSRFDDFLFQLGARRSWRWRLHVLRVQLFPPPGYMKRRYGVSTRGALVRAWAGRIRRGFSGVLRHK